MSKFCMLLALLALAGLVCINAQDSEAPYWKQFPDSSVECAGNALCQNCLNQQFFGAKCKLCLSVTDPAKQAMCYNCLSQHIEPETCLKCAAPTVADSHGCYECLVQKIPGVSTDGSDCAKCGVNRQTSQACYKCLVERRGPAVCLAQQQPAVQPTTPHWVQPTPQQPTEQPTTPHWQPQQPQQPTGGNANCAANALCQNCLNQRFFGAKCALCLSVTDPARQAMCYNCLSQHIEPETCLKCAAPTVADAPGCYECLVQKIPGVSTDGSDCAKCGVNLNTADTCYKCLVERRGPAVCLAGQQPPVTTPVHPPITPVSPPTGPGPQPTAICSANQWCQNCLNQATWGSRCASCLAIKDPYAQQLCYNCLSQHIDPDTCIKCGAPGVGDVAGCYSCLAQKIPTASADGSDCVKCASDAHTSGSCLKCLVQRMPPGYCQQGTFSG